MDWPIEDEMDQIWVHNNTEQGSQKKCFEVNNILNNILHENYFSGRKFFSLHLKIY